MNRKRDPFSRTALRYTFVTMFCVLFGAVYELFSHGVYSYGMIYAFVFPLVLGVFPFLAGSLSGRLQYPALLNGCIYHFGITVLTVGSLMSGVLEIYGTSSGLTVIYWIAGVLFLLVGGILFLLKRPWRKIT